MGYIYTYNFILKKWNVSHKIIHFNSYLFRMAQTLFYLTTSHTKRVGLLYEDDDENMQLLDTWVLKKSKIQ